MTSSGNTSSGNASISKVCTSGQCSSRCIKCHKHWQVALVGIILLAIIAGIALVSLLLFLNLTVAIGTMNGVIFYANIINGNASIFFSNFPTYSSPSVFIAWLNLDIGFDICLFEGIDTYVKTWLQLVFPFYLIFIVVIVFAICRHSQRFSNLIGKKNPVANLATLILLSYAKILSSVTTILSRTTLQYPDGQRVLWKPCLLYTSPSPRDATLSRMPSSA